MNRFGCLVIFALFMDSLQALTYRAPMDEAEWIVERSVFECRLYQPIPIYGEAAFVQRAGGTLSFHLESIPTPMKKGKALLVSAGPSWIPSMDTNEIAYVPVSESNKPVNLDRRLATRLLAELEKGKAPQFTRMSWFADDERINVGLTSVHFRAAYKQYRYCLAELLPVNFEQIQRSRIHFATDKWNLTPKTKQRLDLIVRYAKADPKVNAFYIDGHTDDIADRHYNLELSRRRAIAVNDYLTKNGVNDDFILMRYHGERYPVAKNNSNKNRRINRRVTIRLEKE